MTAKTATKLMQAGSLVVIIFGVIIAFGAHPASKGLTVFLADLMLWPLDGVQTGAASEFGLLAAITGGVMVGWGFCLLILSGQGMREAPDLSSRIITVSLISWFIIDSLGSLAAGAVLNIGLNLLFLLVFLLPLRYLKAARV